MSTYRRIIYQVVFGTKNRKNTLEEKELENLYKYIWGILNRKKCFLYSLGGTSNHIHIIMDLHPSIALADLVKDIKLVTTIWIKKGNIFPMFEGWQEGYGAFTYGIKEKEYLIQYVKNQKAHHQKTTFREEFKNLLIENGIDFNEKYLI